MSEQDIRARRRHASDGGNRSACAPPHWTPIVKRGAGGPADAYVDAMTLDEILRSTMTIEEEIERAAPGSPDLPDVVARLQLLRGELERTRGLQGPLIPDATRPPTDDQKSGEGLERTITSLMAAARAKQS